MAMLLPSRDLPEPLSREHLRQVLNNWWAFSFEHPVPFPGPLAGRKKLAAWVHDIRTRSENRKIPRQQWANAILSWIPAAKEGKVGFRERLLKSMRERRTAGEWEQGRFWKWENFRHLFFELCASEVTKKRLLVGAVAVGSTAALPIIGIPLLGAIGFTSSGVADGSIAAGVQSAVSGGATGGVFSVFQSIGTRAAFPVAWNFVAGAIGAATAAAAAGSGRGSDNVGIAGVDCLGDIGDDDGYDALPRTNLSI